MTRLRLSTDEGNARSPDGPAEPKLERSVVSTCPQLEVIGRASRPEFLAFSLEEFYL